MIQMRLWLCEFVTALPGILLMIAGGNEWRNSSKSLSLNFSPHIHRYSAPS